MLPLRGHIGEIHPTRVKESLKIIQGELDQDSIMWHHLKPIDYFDTDCSLVWHVNLKPLNQFKKLPLLQQFFVKKTP